MKLSSFFVCGENLVHNVRFAGAVALADDFGLFRLRQPYGH